MPIWLLSYVYYQIWFDCISQKKSGFFIYLLVSLILLKKIFLLPFEGKEVTLKETLVFSRLLIFDLGAAADNQNVKCIYVLLQCVPSSYHWTNCSYHDLKIFV
ncbi:hypothetical protein EGR_10881 [Echinococcus granulosus]|uniref:Uncharacterized protein n=1 Tax=Echinococcus granulosus TaxID=6210 RepID=W6U7B8_ECHGR|nr:hypothetical protein EGR_10881 [Echinococcus granulosus]EUB54262.1 hypothetical protein EGR_10881 [Echinococcus granulosus]